LRCLFKIYHLFYSGDAGKNIGYLCINLNISRFIQTVSGLCQNISGFSLETHIKNADSMFCMKLKELWGMLNYRRASDYENRLLMGKTKEKQLFMDDFME